MKTFCKWCNSEAKGGDRRCDLCGSPYCRSHGGMLVAEARVLRIPPSFSADDLFGTFAHCLVDILSDPAFPGGWHHFSRDLTYKNFYDKVYNKVDFKNFPVYLCNYCKEKAPQIIKEALLPILQAAKHSGLICAYSLCPFDSEWKCSNCGKDFCHTHSVRCGRCSNIFCCSDQFVGIDHITCEGGCQKVHKHWLLGREWKKTGRRIS